ncbi:MAG: aminotransferase class IV [Planctomycetota bacterium]|jgi:branched-subunit amino acid aminotransferase/4-amino-4-deoxychorismate lyase|nr:aminotransferase class IV [Planctomycetota bacterium]
MSTTKDFATVLMLDGVQHDASKPVVCASSPSLMRGEGIFEAFLVGDSLPTALLDDHDARLCLSARLAGFEIQPGDLKSRLQQFLPLITDGEWRVRCTILRGEDGHQHWMFSAGPEQPTPDSVILCISDFRLDPLDPMAGAKTISRATHQRARALAIEQGAFEAIFLTIDGDIAEGTSTNIFVYQDGVVSTPPLSRGILGGVTRQNILRACESEGIKCCERQVSLRDLELADEIFVTNAVIGVTPVTKILNIREVLPGSRGSKLKQVQSAYRRHLNSMLQK